MIDEQGLVIVEVQRLRLSHAMIAAQVKPPPQNPITNLNFNSNLNFDSFLNAGEEVQVRVEI